MVKHGFKIIDPCPPVDDRPPMSICNVLGLSQIPYNSYQPGVYFLCKDDLIFELSGHIPWESPMYYMDSFEKVLLNNR